MMRIKPFLSWVLTICFLLLAVSGMVLYASPQGQIAHWNRWTCLGLDKEAWQAVHTNLAVLFLVAGLWHLLLHGVGLLSYARQEKYGWRIVAGALGITGLFLVASILQWQPWALVQRGNNQIKAYWEKHLSRPPSPHAETWTLQEVAQRLGIGPEELLQALREEAVKATSADESLAQIASQTGMTPRQIFDIIRQHFPQADQLLQPGAGKGRGLRKTGEK